MGMPTRGGIGRKTNPFRLFSVPLTPKVPLAFSWKLAGSDEFINKYLSPPYSPPSTPAFKGQSLARHSGNTVD